MSIGRISVGRTIKARSNVVPHYSRDSRDVHRPDAITIRARMQIPAHYLAGSEGELVSARRSNTRHR